MAIVVLAAGGSRRFGSPKQLALWRGEPLVRRVVREALASTGEGPWVVLGSRSNGVAAALDGLDWQRVENPRWAQGQSTSVRAAVAALPPSITGSSITGSSNTGSSNTGSSKTGSSIDAALFVPCDQPFLGAAVFDRLIDVYRRELASIVVPVYGSWPRPEARAHDRRDRASAAGRRADEGRRGAPVLWAREHFPALEALEGDTGARVLLRERKDRVRQVPIDDPRAGIDVDTPRALAELAAADAASGRPG